ncbi:MAG TPA: MarR family transcriptional regulator [Gemmatimonadales bacterium]|nr:MarR family transcriptional regulator [Gemmatimonadales bacterium]
MPPTHPRPTRAALEQSFIATLGPLRRQLRRVFDRELAALGVSTAQSWPILLIGQRDGMRQRELAERLEIEGPTLVRVLDQLEALGLVERRPDPDDQRAKTLHLTRAGTALSRRLQPAFESARARLLADVSGAELETCLRVCTKVFDAIAREGADSAA